MLESKSVKFRSRMTWIGCGFLAAGLISLGALSRKGSGVMKVSISNLVQRVFRVRTAALRLYRLKDFPCHHIIGTGTSVSHSSSSIVIACAAVSASVCFLLLSVSAAAQVAPSQNNAQSKSPFDRSYPDLMSAPPVIGRSTSSASEPIRCDTVSIASTDPWIRTADLTARLLGDPKFVLSGIAISPDAEHADLSIQLAAARDEDGTRMEYLALAVSSVRMNLEEQMSLFWPATDYEEFMSEKVLNLLFTHCFARRDAVAQQPQLPSELVRQELLVARTMKCVVRTPLMRDRVFLSALRARPEFAAWGIKIVKDNETADFDLVVGHILSTLTWTFRLIDTRTEGLMDSGTEMAFHDDRAAARISAAVVKRISERRPLPAFLSTASQQVDSAGMPEFWEVKAVLEDMLKRFPDKMRLLIGNGVIRATDLKGVTLFSISANKVIDFADTKAYDKVGDSFRLDEDAWIGCDENCAVSLLVYVPILLVLDQFHVPLHIFDIAWMEDDTVRVASLRVSRGNYQNLLMTLKFLLESQSSGSY